MSTALVKTWVDPKDFRAACDGKTDDTAALQAAINYAIVMAWLKL